MSIRTKPQPLSIVDAMADPEIFGPLFAGESWRACRVFLGAVFGLALNAEELSIFQRHTRRQRPPREPVPEAWVVAGRRGGKGRVAALVAVSLACLRDYAGILAPGERGTLMVIATDRRQARVVKGYISGLLGSVPMLAALVVNETAESIELSTGIIIEIHTASFRTIRGYTVVAAVLDEIAFWPTEDAANPDVEVLNAARPSMATVPGALLLVISTPYARRGELWRMYRGYFGKESDRVLVWQADTRAMNPTIAQEVIDAAYAQDEAVASAEYGAQFRRDLETFINPEAVEARVVPGRYELPPVDGTDYVGFVDPAGGSGADAMTLGIAHGEERDGYVVAVLDCLRVVRPPFSPDQVVGDFAATLKLYNVSTIHGDNFGGEWPKERFEKRDIKYEKAEKTKSEIYKELLSLLNSGRTVLLDHKQLLVQLCGLERRVGRGGKDSIDHGPNAHDDAINATASALVAASKPKRAPYRFLGGDIEPDLRSEDEIQRDAERAVEEAKRVGADEVQAAIQQTGVYWPSR